MNSIGCNICNLRKQSNMSQEQLAEKLGVSRQSVSKWERDEAMPDLYNLEAISDIFGVSIDYIVKNKMESIGSESIPSETDIAERESLIRKANILLIIAITMYISDVFFLGGMWDELDLSNGIMTAIFGLVVAIATAMVIYQGFLRSKAKRLYPGFENAPDEDDDNPCYTIFGCIAFIIFMLLGFIYGLWHIAWIAFPIGGVLGYIANMIFPWRRENKSK